MSSLASPCAVHSLPSLTVPPVSLSSPSSASAPLSPSSARRSLALLFGQLSALLAVAYYLAGRIVPCLDWVGELGVEAVKARSAQAGSAASRATASRAVGSSSASSSDDKRRSSSLTRTLSGPSLLLCGRSLLASPSPQSQCQPQLPAARVAPSPSARMATLRSRQFPEKAVRLSCASPMAGQRSLSQPAQPPPQWNTASPRKRAPGFTLPSLLSPPLSRSPSAPPSPRSPRVVASNTDSFRGSVARSTVRLWASLQAEEELGTLAARIQLTNVLATVFAVGLLVMFLCMRALVSTGWSSQPLMAATLVCPLLLALVPTLNHFRHTTLSRVLLVLLVNGSLFLLTCSTRDHGFNSLFYGCMPLPLLLFDASRALASLPFLLSASVPVVFHSLVTFVVYSSSLYTLNAFASSVILSAVLLHLVSSYQTTHQSLLSASRSSRAAHVAMTSLMHSISHELRTPLNAVCGYAELLLMDDTLAAGQQDMVKTIADNADALTKLVSDFLTFSSSSSGQLRVDAEIMDVEEMLDSCVATHALSAHKKGLELLLEVMDDVPALVLGDGQRMREVLSNLISNSIKASATGCILIRVSVDQPSQPLVASSSFSASLNPKAAAASSAILVLRFEVRDEGIGITAEQQKRLFKPFQAVNPGDASSTSSLSSSSFGNSRGLGLAICHSLVQQMGGAIGVISAPEDGQQGSVFHFTVQVHMVDMGEDAMPTLHTASTGGSGCGSTQLLDAFGQDSSDRKHTRILPVSEGDESEAESETSSNTFTPPRSLGASAAALCLSSPIAVSSSLVRHVLLVSPNRTARDVYARIFLQTRGWFVTLCEDESEARLRLFDSPCPALRRIENLSGANRATSSPPVLDDLTSSVESCGFSSAQLFDCVVLDQVAGMDLSTVQRFALNIQSRLDIPCVILTMPNTASPPHYLRMVSGRQDESHNCTPQSSPLSDTYNTRSLFATTDESLSTGPLSPALSANSSASSTPVTFSTALAFAPCLPRPPSLQMPHYSNITPPTSHVQQLNTLLCLLAKPVRKKVLIGKVRALMEQARQQQASRRKRELRDRMQHERQVAHTHQAAAEDAHRRSSSLHCDEGAVFPTQLPELSYAHTVVYTHKQLKEYAECKQQPSAAVGSVDLPSPPLRPTAAVSATVLQSSPAQQLSLPLLAAPLLLSRDSSIDSRPSPSMLRSLDKLTSAARATSAPAMHAVFVPSRSSSGTSSPIREEKDERRVQLSQQQVRGSSPFSAASTTSPSSSIDSPSFSGSSSSRSSSAALSADSPSPPRPFSSPPHLSCPAFSLASYPSSACMPASPPSSLSQLRVLVAEDTITNQKIIGRMLQRIGVSHVTIVNDGRECVQTILGRTARGGEQQLQQYHCILMDLLMPVVDGWQATEQLRAAGYDLPIVALSASAMKSDRGAL